MEIQEYNRENRGCQLSLQRTKLLSDKSKKATTSCLDFLYNRSFFLEYYFKNQRFPLKFRRRFPLKRSSPQRASTIRKTVFLIIKIVCLLSKTFRRVRFRRFTGRSPGIRNTLVSGRLCACKLH